MAHAPLCFSGLALPALQQLLNGGEEFNTASQTRTVGEYTVTSSYGRDPARFSITGAMGGGRESRHR